MIRRTSSWVIIVLLLVLNGCAGKSETVMLYPGALPADRTDIAVSQEKLTVIIVPFEDQRPEKGEIGRRTHFGGGYTSYAVWNDMPGYVIAQFMADYLKQKGWEAAVVLPGEPIDVQKGVEAVISGQVEATILPPIADGQCHAQSPLALSGVMANGRMVPVSGG